MHLRHFTLLPHYSLLIHLPCSGHVLSPKVQFLPSSHIYIGIPHMRENYISVLLGRRYIVGLGSVNKQLPYKQEDQSFMWDPQNPHETWMAVLTCLNPSASLRRWIC